MLKEETRLLRLRRMVQGRKYLAVLCAMGVIGEHVRPRAMRQREGDIPSHAQMNASVLVMRPSGRVISNRTSPILSSL